MKYLGYPDLPEKNVNPMFLMYLSRLSFSNISLRLMRRVLGIQAGGLSARGWTLVVTIAAVLAMRRIPDTRSTNLMNVLVVAIAFCWLQKWHANTATVTSALNP